MTTQSASLKISDNDNLQSRILVLDFGSQYSHLIVRRMREIGVYSEIMSCLVPLESIDKFKPKGIILSGGPSSVYKLDSAHVCAEFWNYVKSKDIPLLGICYGLQEIIYSFKGTVEKAESAEFGDAELTLIQSPSNEQVYPLFSRLISQEKQQNINVWMSHSDKVTYLPEDFEVIASSPNCSYAAVAHKTLKIFGLQFHPEVTHTPSGFLILQSFVLDICKLAPNWSMDLFADIEIQRVKQIVGDSYVIGALSGGVDSSVAAAIISRAIGPKFQGFLIDTGFLRLGEGVEIVARLKKEFPSLNVKCIDASEEYFQALMGVVDPEKKRKIIGELFIKSFEKAVKSLDIPLDGTYLLQGTLYPDVIESTSFMGPSHTIKSHHNVGCLPKDMKLTILEPLRELFKDEVRKLGLVLGLSKDVVYRHPFPGPGLAIRIIGECTRERTTILQKADYILIEEIKKSGDYDNIGQAFVVLLPDTKSVGVMGDCRTYGMTAVIRAVETSDFMTADWYRFPYHILSKVSSRIINEVDGINRVCYDISSKPPSTIEWE